MDQDPHGTPNPSTQERRSARSPAPRPRTSLRKRVTAQIKREDYREAQAQERATKALAAQAAAASAAEAAAREAAAAARAAEAAARAAEAAARAAEAEQSKRAAARDAAIWKEAYANVQRQLDARRTSAATAPPPTAPPEETFVPPRSNLADMQRSNAAEERRRAARSPTGSPTDPLPSERPMPTLSAAATTVRRRRRTTAEQTPTAAATVPTETPPPTTRTKPTKGKARPAPQRHAQAGGPAGEGPPPAATSTQASPIPGPRTYYPAVDGAGSSQGVTEVHPRARGEPQAERRRDDSS